MMFVAMIVVFIFLFVFIALTNKKNETAVAEENTVIEPTTNWDLLFAKIEQDNADLLAQEELAEIVRSLSEEISAALDARRYDGIECLEELEAALREVLYSSEFEEQAKQAEAGACGKNIEGTWLHAIPEQYLPGFTSLQREVCVTSVESGSTYGLKRPLLVLKGTCRYLFSGNANSVLTPDENGRLDRYSWAHPFSESAHDEGWLWVPTSDLLEILVPSEDMKIRVQGLGLNCPVSVIPEDVSHQEFIWDRYQVPASKRGVTPSNIEKEIK